MADLAFARHSAAQTCSASLSFDAALARMIDGVRPLDEETIALGNAAGRVLSRPVIAAAASPNRNLAAMDGYAVRDIAAGAGSAMLKVVGQAAPAAPYPHLLGHGEAVRVFTGAPTPEGTDRVVPQELVKRSGDLVAIPTEAGQARHVRQCGSDFTCGSELLSAGRLLDPRAILVANAADAGTISVYRKPCVFVLATGDELRRPGTRSQNAHSIPDSVSPAVGALAQDWGAELVGTRLVPDQPDAIKRDARDAIERADILVITGGASVGNRDFSKAALQSLGLDFVFQNVAMKPGKPIWYGRVGTTHVLGLPGNPTAALVTARLFLAPLLCELQGCDPETALRWRSMALDTPLAASGPREVFLCGVGEGEKVRLIDRQFASGQASLAMSNALIRCPKNAPPKAIGTTIMTLDF